MLTAERYLTLYDRFNGAEPAGTYVEATVDELADILFCTPRNVKFILRKLEEDQLITWTPGLGRGNRSKIAFLVEKETYLYGESRILAERGDYKHGFELLDKYSYGTRAKETFMEWLNSHFGYKKVELSGHIAQDILRFPVFRPILTLDPAEVNLAFDAHLARQIFGRLVQFDEKQGKIVASIAHTWTSNSDSTEWVFYLRKGVLFHNGQTLTSEDVAYTFSRLRNGKANSWVARGLSEVQILGPWVVRFRFDQPNRIFDRFLCSAAASLLPKDLGGQEEEAYWALPIGCGPFRFQSVSAHGIQLAAHAAYFAGRPYLDGVRVVIVPEDCQDVLDSLPEVLQSEHASLTEDSAIPPAEEPKQRLVQVVNGCSMIVWNMNRSGPHQSEAFRRAVRMILNPVRLIEALGGKRALPATGFRPEVSMSTPIVNLDPDRVKAALGDSRYDGSALRICAHKKFIDDANWIAGKLSEWGIPAEISVKTWQGDTEANIVTDGDLLLSSVGFAEDEVCEIEFYEHSECVVQSYLDPDRLSWITRHIDASLRAETQGQRRLLLREIEERLRDEASVIFLYHSHSDQELPSSVKGASLNGLGMIDFKDIWFENPLLTR